MSNKVKGRKLSPYEQRQADRKKAMRARAKERHEAWLKSRGRKVKSKSDVDPVTKKKTNKRTKVTEKDTKTTAFIKRGGALGWANRKRKRLRDKLKVATDAFKKG